MYIVQLEYKTSTLVNNLQCVTKKLSESEIKFPHNLIWKNTSSSNCCILLTLTIWVVFVKKIILYPYSPWVGANFSPPAFSLSFRHGFHSGELGLSLFNSTTQDGMQNLVILRQKLLNIWWNRNWTEKEFIWRKDLPYCLFIILLCNNLNLTTYITIIIFKWFESFF